ncbi:hypothetical protein SFUMM280S_03315 [Streptomyces fumanus]
METATYTQTASYPLDGADAPADLEAVDGRIWFGYADRQLGSLDVSGAEPVVRLDQDGTALGAAPMLAADPAAPGVLAAGGGGRLAVFDVSADGAALRVAGSLDSSVKQLDLTPDGTQVLASWDGTGSGYGLPAYSTTDLTEVRSYPIDAYPNAVRIAPDGTIAGGSYSLVRAGRPHPPRRRPEADKGVRLPRRQRRQRPRHPGGRRPGLGAGHQPGSSPSPRTTTAPTRCAP